MTVARAPRRPPSPVSDAPRPSRIARFFAGCFVVLDTLFLMALAVFCVLDALGPERWWVTGFLLYMPRAFWAAGAAVLLAPTAWIAWRRRRGAVRAAALLGASLIWILGPVMGLRVPFRLFAAGGSRPSGTHLRVLTYNVKWGRRGTHEIAGEIQRVKPDLIQMQDSGDILQSEVGQLLTPAHGWNVRSSGQYVVASRWPLSELSLIELSFPKSGFQAVRCTLIPPGGGAPVTLYNAHLLSARYGLISVRHRSGNFLDANIQDRLAQADRLASAIASSPRGPILLTGDLNAPPSSLVKRRLRETGLRDAWEAAGWGYGFSYGQSTKFGRPYIRIDCVLTSPDIRADALRVGNTVGSDHCPVIADLVLPARR